MSEMQSPATGYHGGARENDFPGRNVARDIAPEAAWPQERTIGTVAKGRRSRIEVDLVRTFDRVRRVRVRTTEQNGRGLYTPQGRAIVFTPSQLDAIIGVLLDARAALIEEGLIT